MIIEVSRQVEHRPIHRVGGWVWEPAAQCRSRAWLGRDNCNPCGRGRLCSGGTCNGPESGLVWFLLFDSEFCNWYCTYSVEVLNC
jgi:hypothetical protein